MANPKVRRVAGSWPPSTIYGGHGGIWTPTAHEASAWTAARIRSSERNLPHPHSPTRSGIFMDKQNERKMSETTWKKEPAIGGEFGGCLNCGPRPSIFPATGVIAVGFGYAALHRDGDPIYTEPNEPEPESDDEYMTGAKAEEMAAEDPDHDWRIVMDGPLSGRTYQRNDAGEWALIEQNQGFA